MTREEHIENLKAMASDMPSDKCADWIESLMAGVKALEQEPCGDCISRESIIGIVNHQRFGMSKLAFSIITEKVKELPSVTPQPKMGSSSENPNKWIPVKWHEITDEEREREGYPKDWACRLDSIMPYDGQRILITTKGGFVELDECYSDDGCTFSLDSGYDWVDDVIAWMPLPEPYKQEVEK